MNDMHSYMHYACIPHHVQACTKSVLQHEGTNFFHRHMNMCAIPMFTKHGHHIAAKSVPLLQGSLVNMSMSMKSLERYKYIIIPHA